MTTLNKNQILTLKKSAMSTLAVHGERVILDILQPDEHNVLIHITNASFANGLYDDVLNNLVFNRIQSMFSWNVQIKVQTTYNNYNKIYIDNWDDLYKQDIALTDMQPYYGASFINLLNEIVKHNAI